MYIKSENMYRVKCLCRIMCECDKIVTRKLGNYKSAIYLQAVELAKRNKNSSFGSVCYNCDVGMICRNKHAVVYIHVLCKNRFSSFHKTKF